MRTFFIQRSAGEAISLEINARGISNVNLLSAIANKYGTQLFTLDSSFFSITSEGFFINVSSSNVTSSSLPMVIVISYNSVPIISLKVNPREVTTSSGSFDVHVGSTAPSSPQDGTFWVVYQQ